MQDVKVVLNRRGVRQLLTSTEVTNDLRKRAERIQDRAVAHGGGADSTDYPVEVSDSGRRSRASVRTGSPFAMYQEATDRSLTSSLDAGR